MRELNILFMILLVIGGLNWGMIGFFQFNVLASLIGEHTVALRTVYSLVGISAIFCALYSLPRVFASPAPHLS